MPVQTPFGHGFLFRGVGVKAPASYVYINHRIREPKPRGPVIAVQTGKTVRNTNRAQLLHNGVVIGEVLFKKGGLRAAPDHHVRAFVALSQAVEIRYPRART